MARDLYSNIKVAPAIAAAVQSASVDGVAIDTKGANAVSVVVTTGAIVSSGDFGLKLQESDASGSGYADVPAALQQSNAPATLAASSAYRLGYLGSKRYVRLVATKAGGTSIALGAVAVLGDLAARP